jgi:fatty acyl-CoA reductase
MSAPLSDRYTGQVVLLTGATGFLGKVILERMLYEFPAMGQLRVLIRATKDETAAVRLEKLLRLKLFERLQRRHGGVEGFESWAKGVVVAVAGDIEQDYLGMEGGEYEKLKKDLMLVIHCAALVSWDERIDRSINANCLGAQRVMKLTDSNPTLTRFLYVSSAFVNGMRCEKERCLESAFDPGVSIMKELHPSQAPPFSLEAEIQAAAEYASQAEAHAATKASFMPEAKKRAMVGAAMSADEIAEGLRQRSITQDIADWGVERARSHGWFDNYTYSKALAEMILVRDKPTHVDLSIVRPSGITAALLQPMVGWLDAYLLVEPLIHGMGTGMITAFPGDPNGVIDVIPCDMVTSVILAAAVSNDMMEKQGAGGDSNYGDSIADSRVYHVGSGSLQPIRLKEIEQVWREYFHAHPMKKKGSSSPVSVAPIRFYSSAKEFESMNTRSYLTPLQWGLWAIEHLPMWGSIPLLRSGWNQANRLQSLVQKTLRLASLYCTYTLNEWTFDTAKTEKLMGGLHDEDRTSFSFDVKGIDWPHFWTQVHIPFMRKYLLEEEGYEPPTAIAAAGAGTGARSRL